MNAFAPNSGAIECHPGWRAVLELSAQEVFELMLGTHLVVEAEPGPDSGLEITAMVGLAGLLCGVMTVRCSARSAARMAGKMLGVEAETALPEMCDALGEICNMIAGNFKNKIAGLGDGCLLSVPIVITGGDYSCHRMGHPSSLRVGFLMDGDRIMATLEIHT